MNMKEAFRFQNKLKTILEEAKFILGQDRNVTKTENTYLRKKVMPEAENETVVEAPSTEYADRINELVAFTLCILDEKERLFRAIRKAKAALAIDIDNETSLNGDRQSVASMLAHMAGLHASETTLSNGGYGFRFNAEGNQVSYKCDVKKVTTINFDRNVVREKAKQLHAKADSISADIDRCVVNATVDYEAPFDVNGSFADIFEEWVEKHAAA